MSLEFIGDSDRNRLRVHGALLLIWSALVGSASSALLLHVFQVHSIAVRYCVGAAAVYFLGFLGGARCYAAWWNQKQEHVRPIITHASPEDQKSYRELRAQRWKTFFNHLFPLPYWLNLPFFDWLIFIALIVGSAFYLVHYFPIVVVDTAAGYLAEVVLEFVIGASILHQILKPRALDEYWPVMVKRTWITGCLLIAAAGSLGFVIQHWKPGAETIFQALR